MNSWDDAWDDQDGNSRGELVSSRDCTEKFELEGARDEFALRTACVHGAGRLFMSFGMVILMASMLNTMALPWTRTCGGGGAQPLPGDLTSIEPDQSASNLPLPNVLVTVGFSNSCPLSSCTLPLTLASYDHAAAVCRNRLAPLHRPLDAVDRHLGMLDLDCLRHIFL